MIIGPSSISFLLIRLITPPKALEPYKLEEGPLTTSMLSISDTEILFKSKAPNDLPIIGKPLGV